MVSRRKALDAKVNAEPSRFVLRHKLLGDLAGALSVLVMHNDHRRDNLVDNRLEPLHPRPLFNLRYGGFR
jgi:hypothetical protein